jgi:hypothetical protein
MIHTDLPNQTGDRPNLSTLSFGYLALNGDEAHGIDITNCVKSINYRSIQGGAPTTKSTEICHFL